MKSALRIKMEKLVESKFDTDSITEFYNRMFVDMAEHGYRLAIEEGKPKECKHEPMLKTFDFTCWQHGVCRKCGIELVAEWKQKDLK